MAEHRALQAIKRLQQRIIAADTDAHDTVEVGRVANLTEGVAIGIEVGPDTPQNEFGTDNPFFIDSTQRVYLDLHARGSHELEVVERIFALRAQTHAAILADPTLGLSFVISARYQGAEEIVRADDGEQIAGMRTIWDMFYRMSYDDATS